MDLNELQQLIASLEASGLRSLELSRPGERVKLTVGDNHVVQVTAADDPAPSAPETGAQEASGGITVLTEAAGLFLATHPMRSAPLAEIGLAVKKHDVLGLLKIGPVYAPVTAPADGVVTQVLAADGALLGFGAPVLELAPAAENA